jgi:hypothetical protein
MGKRPNIANIKVWGSIAYKKEPNTGKLDLKAKPFILIGFKGPNYRLVSPGSRTMNIIEARDIYIYENIFIKDIYR